ncbi:MAG TPA: ABC transporter ATP-binding protein [Planctomycetota bacterium]|nr:ABC transporter ATP-binding protein [Planctomycetota bacterium]
MLKISNLSSGYQTKEVIKDISFTVNQGEFVGVIGPNGSGKTTLFRTITKIIPGYTGNLLYKEKEIRDWSVKTLAREIAVVPQFLLMAFPFKVYDFVALGRTPYLGRFEMISGRDKEVIKGAMDITGCSGLRERMVTELSGGELQRVFLAQALAQEPKLLLLDEPTSHLDIGHQVEILHLLKQLNKENGLTIVVILHDLNTAGEYCNRLILMEEGKIYKSGSPVEVLTYQNIEAVYKTVVVVKDNPISGNPYVIPVPKDRWETNGRTEEPEGTA